MIRTVWEYLLTFKSLQDVLSRSLKQQFQIISPGIGINKINNIDGHPTNEENKIIERNMIEMRRIDSEHQDIIQKKKKIITKSLAHTKLMSGKEDQSEHMLWILDENKKLREQRKRLDSKMENLEQENKQLKESMHANDAETKGKLATILKEIHQLEEANEELATQYYTALQQKDELQQKYDVMEEQVKLLENERQELKEQLEATRNKLTATEEKMEQMQIEFHELETRLVREHQKSARKLKESEIIHSERLEQSERMYNERIAQLERSLLTIMKKIFTLIYRTKLHRVEKLGGTFHFQGFVYKVPNKTNMPGSREAVMDELRKCSDGSLTHPDFIAVAYRVNMGEHDQPNCMAQKFGCDRLMRIHDGMEMIAEKMCNKLLNKKVHGCLICLSKHLYVWFKLKFN